MAFNPFGAGSSALTDDVRPFLVTLARRRQPAPVTRAQVVERGIASSRAFCQRLVEFVDQTNRNGELRQIGTPTSFGIVSIVSTKELADAINQFPEVESVIEDTASVSLVR